MVAGDLEPIGVLSALVIVGYLFMAGVLIFPPAAIPGLPVWYARRYDWLDFSAFDVAVLVPLFAVPIAFRGPTPRPGSSP